MTARRHGFVALLAVAGFAATGAGAAEIAGSSGLVTLAYDESAWTAQLDEEGQPELACASEACGGNTAGCGTVLVARDGEALSEESFLGGFRENLDANALDSAAKNGGPGASPEIVAPASVATFGDKTGVSLSMRVVFDGHPTRVDHFWLQAGADLVGITCIVANSGHERAASAFQQIFAGISIAAP